MDALTTYQSPETTTIPLLENAVMFLNDIIYLHLTSWHIKTWRSIIYFQRYVSIWMIASQISHWK